MLTPRQHEENWDFPFREYFYAPSLGASGVTVCAIPKNGCTTLKAWLLNAAGIEFRPEEVHHAARATMAANLLEPLGRAAAIEKSACMTFVRDPLKRLASAYMEKFVGGHRFGYFEPAREAIEQVARTRGVEVDFDTTANIDLGWCHTDVPACSRVDYERGITFREFIEYVCAEPDDHLDVHWRPQSAFLLDHRFDFIGRVQSMSESLHLLSSWLGVAPPVDKEASPVADTPADGVFYGDQPCGELTKLWIGIGVDGLFDEEMVQRVRERFAGDFAVWKQALPLPPAGLKERFLKSADTRCSASDQS